jgi:excisionase family DNA binding protein
MKLLTIEEAAKYLSVNKETLRRWDRSGKLRAFKINKAGHRRYSLDSLETYVKGNTDPKLNIDPKIRVDFNLKKWRLEFRVWRVKNAKYDVFFLFDIGIGVLMDNFRQTGFWVYFDILNFQKGEGYKAKGFTYRSENKV